MEENYEELVIEDVIAELRAAGFSEELITREVAYLERVKLEDERIRSDKAWNYGFHGA